MNPPEWAKMTKLEGMRKKRMGRPPKSEEDKQKNRIALSLTDSESKGLTDVEQFLGVTEKAAAARAIYLEGYRVFLERMKKQGKKPGQ
jgi:hypothetical protein